MLSGEEFVEMVAHISGHVDIWVSDEASKPCVGVVVSLAGQREYTFEPTRRYGTFSKDQSL